MTTTNPDTISQLSGVSCTSVSFCVAVGEYSGLPGNGNNLSDQSLAEQWNGSSWSTMTTTNPTTDDGLTGVSCTSPSFCVAVGSSQNGTVAEQWNGSSWSTMTTIPGDANILNGVSCSSATFCVAVGYSSTGDPEDLKTLAEQWNGSSWTTMTTTNPSTADTLYGVSCKSTSFCVAGGYYYDSGADLTLAELYASQP